MAPLLAAALPPSAWPRSHHPGTEAAPQQHQCVECGKTFGNTWHLRRHRLTHTGEKPYVCPVCGLRGNQRANVKSHVLLKHPEYALYECPGKGCGKKYVTEEELLEHRQTSISYSLWRSISCSSSRRTLRRTSISCV